MKDYLWSWLICTGPFIAVRLPWTIGVTGYKWWFLALDGPALAIFSVLAYIRAKANSAEGER